MENLEIILSDGAYLLRNSPSIFTRECDEK